MKTLAEILTLALVEYERSPIDADYPDRPYMCGCLTYLYKTDRITYVEWRMARQAIRKRIFPCLTLYKHLAEQNMPNTYTARYQWYKDWIEELDR